VTPGQNLYGCVGPDLWQALGGISVFDPGVRMERSDANTLQLGADCTMLHPCRFRFGSVVHTRVQPGQLTLSGTGSGEIFVYVNREGQFGVAMTPASSLSLSCAGCVVEGQASGFPVDSIPLWTWSASSGEWTPVGNDQRTTLGTGRRLVAGANSIVTETGDGLEIATANYLPQGALVGGETLRLGGAPPVGGTLFGLGAEVSVGAAGGTLLGLNAAAGFTGDLAHWQVNGEPRFRWGADGRMEAAAPSSMVTWWGNGSAATGSSFRLAIAGTGAGERFSLGTGSNGAFLVANGLRKVAVGSTAPEPETADLLVQDAGAAGDTQMAIRAGAGQARDPWQVQSAVGTALVAVTADGALALRPTGTKPTCTAGRRGQLWFTSSAAGVADQLEVCSKTATDSYQWNALY
jgi:hypothetical protein